MECLRSRLHRHQTIRRLLPRHEECNYEDDENLRSGLEVQRRASKALATYCDNVIVAFKAMLKAHEALTEGGLCELEEVRETADALLSGFRGAHAKAVEMAKDLRVPLEVHQARLRACQGDVAAADRAAEDHRWYTEKVNGINATETRRLRQGERLMRNEQKLQRASHNIDLLQARSDEALRECSKRKAALVDMAAQALDAVAGALHLSCEAALLTSTTTPPEAAADGQRALNPFECDLELEPPMALGSNPFDDVEVDEESTTASIVDECPRASALPPERRESGFMRSKI